MIALVIPLALVLAWAGGEIRTKEATIERIQNISGNIVNISQVGDNLFQGHKQDNPQDLVYIAVVNKPSYAGPITVAAVVSEAKKIEHVAILESDDTSSYLDKIVSLGILGAFIDQPLEKIPSVDSITGATLSSAAITRGLEKAANQIGASKFDLPEITEDKTSVTPEKSKLIAIALFFFSAFYVMSKRFPWDRNKARFTLLTLSVLTLGFMYGCLFSLSTVVTLLSGNWIKGMASYAALLCLVLALVFFLFSGKNIYCSAICPFGAVQEGLGKITGCSAPVRFRWMAWVARSWVFLVLATALFLHTSSGAIYEPFGKAFNFIGSGTIYALTILAIISSLAFKRPWCLLFCPVTSIFDYLRFAKKAFWGNPASKAQTTFDNKALDK